MLKSIFYRFSKYNKTTLLLVLIISILCLGVFYFLFIARSTVSPLRIGNKIALVNSYRSFISDISYDETILVEHIDRVNPEGIYYNNLALNTQKPVSARGIEFTISNDLTVDYFIKSGGETAVGYDIRFDPKTETILSNIYINPAVLSEENKETELSNLIYWAVSDVIKKSNYDYNPKHEELTSDEIYTENIQANRNPIKTILK